MQFINIQETDLICGHVTVPEKYDNPDGPQIKIAIVIIPAQSDVKYPDPLFIAQGGPGGSTIDTYLEVLLTQGGFVLDRDMVLFDQRGTLYSTPSLMCPEIYELVIDTIESRLSKDESNRLEIEAITHCRDRLQKDGINLSAYNSLENASDINAIREALGYDQINIYGVSYGTLLALHAMKLHPEMLRSAILDAVVPPQNNFILDAPLSMDRSFKLLFQSCKTDVDCYQSYPELETKFRDTIAYLEKYPTKVPMTDPETGITYNVIVDGETFQWGLFQMLYATSLIPALPRMINDASTGNYIFFGRIMAILLFDQTTSYGMYYSVLCAEDADFDLSDYNLSNVDPLIAEMEKDNPQLFQEVCKLWNVQSLPDSIDAPVVSQIPTLLLSGQFDPITPPSYGMTASETLEQSYHFIFPSGGHGQALEGECQDQIIRDFLADPYTAPNTQCIEELQSPNYFSPKNTIDIPQLDRFLNPDRVIVVKLLLLFGALLYSLTTILVIPLTWLISRIAQKNQRFTKSPDSTAYQSVDPKHAQYRTIPEIQSSVADKEPIPMRFSGIIAIFASLTITIFIFGFIAIIIYMIVNNDNRLFFGFMSEAKFLFTLPVVFLILTVLMLISNFQAWFQKSWGVARRFYYSSVTIATVICITILAQWGLVTLLF